MGDALCAIVRRGVVLRCGWVNAGALRDKRGVKVGANTGSA